VHMVDRHLPRDAVRLVLGRDLTQQNCARLIPYAPGGHTRLGEERRGSRQDTLAVLQNPYGCER
jgi:hypothetical protein